MEKKSFRELMAACQSGSPEAVKELYDEYGKHVLRVVRHHLPAQLRPRFDSLDFTQDVWASFLKLDRELGFETPAALVAYLATMARNKVTDAFRQRTTQKNDVRRESSFVGDGGTEVPIPGSDPTPSQAAIAEETWHQMLTRQLPAYRPVLVMTREGKTPEEIATAVGISSRTVRRILEQAFLRLTEQ